MVTRHAGGEAVQGGIYWSMGAGEFISVPPEGGRLAGGPKDRYVKAPLPLVLIVGPMLGLAFAIFLPLSGLLVLIPFLASKVRDLLSPGRVSVAHMAGPSVAPGASYLEQRSRRGTVGEAERADTSSPEPEGKLIDLAKEIAEKRWRMQ